MNHLGSPSLDQLALNACARVHVCVQSFVCFVRIESVTPFPLVGSVLEAGNLK